MDLLIISDGEASVLLVTSGNPIENLLTLKAVKLR